MNWLDLYKVDSADLVAEFNWTRPRHRGDLTLAAPIFGITPNALQKRLREAIKRGIEVEFDWLARP